MKGTPFKSVLGAQRSGKTALSVKMIQEALDRGENIMIVSPHGNSPVIGAGTAKDITPTQKRIEKK